MPRETWREIKANKSNGNNRRALSVSRRYRGPNLHSFDHLLFRDCRSNAAAFDAAAAAGLFGAVALENAPRNFLGRATPDDVINHISFPFFLVQRPFFVLACPILACPAT